MRDPGDDQATSQLDEMRGISGGKGDGDRSRGNRAGNAFGRGVNRLRDLLAVGEVAANDAVLNEVRVRMAVTGLFERGPDVKVERSC